MENIWRKTLEHLSPLDSGSVTQRIRLRGFSSFTDGDQHWCCLWEKRPRREGGLQPHGLPRHGEAAERRDHRAQRTEQHQAVRLLLPHHQRQRPVSGRGPERTQITAKVGLRRALGDPTQVHVPAQPGPAALPGAARNRTPELPLGRRAVLLLCNRHAVQPVCPVVRTCGELHACYYDHAWVCSAGPVSVNTTSALLLWYLNNWLLISSFPFLSHQSTSVLHSGDIQAARKYGRLSLLFSCVAMLLGVALLIFMGITLGIEESPNHKRIHKGRCEAVCVKCLFSLSLRYA